MQKNEICFRKTHNEGWGSRHIKWHGNKVLMLVVKTLYALLNYMNDLNVVLMTSSYEPTIGIS